MNPSQAEHFILKHFNSKKDTCAFRFQDTKDATARFRAMNPFGIPDKVVAMLRNPSDFVVCENGVVSFCEVKSTTNIRGITSTLFSQQKGCRDRIVKCGCPYIYYIHSSVLNRWFRVPAEVVIENGNRSWDELRKFEWNVSN